MKEKARARPQELELKQRLKGMLLDGLLWRLAQCALLHPEPPTQRWHAPQASLIEMFSVEDLSSPMTLAYVKLTKNKNKPNKQANQYKALDHSGR